MSNNNDSNNKKDEEKAKDQKGDWSLWGVLGSAALVGAALLFAGSDSNNDNEELNARKKNISEEEELAELFEGLDINVKRAKFIVGKGYNKDSLERTSEEELMKLLPNTSDHYKYSQYLQKRRKNNNMTKSNQDEIKVTPTLTRNQSDEEPSSLLCPISMELMTDPVIAADGHTYQRKSITDWLQKHNSSPMTNEPLKHKELLTNYALKSVVDEHIAKRKATHPVPAS